MTHMPGKHDFTIEEDVILHTLVSLGQSSEEIAEAVGYPLAVVAWRRTQLGYDRMKLVWTADMDRRLQAMRVDGVSVAKMGKALGCSKRAVYARLGQLGIRSTPVKPPVVDPMIGIVADISRRVVSNVLDDKAQQYAIQVAGAALRAMLSDPRLEIRLRDPS